MKPLLVAPTWQLLAALRLLRPPAPDPSALIENLHIYGVASGRSVSAWETAVLERNVSAALSGAPGRQSYRDVLQVLEKSQSNFVRDFAVRVSKTVPADDLRMPVNRYMTAAERSVWMRDAGKKAGACVGITAAVVALSFVGPPTAPIRRIAALGGLSWGWALVFGLILAAIALSGRNQRVRP